jgi:hypothetical protein
VPVGLVVLLAIAQIARMINHVAEWVRSTDLSGFGDREAMISTAQNVGQWLLHALQNAAGSLAGDRHVGHNLPARISLRCW